jgi:hypothetical protein
MNTNQIAVHVNNAARHGLAPVAPLQPLVDLILAGYAVDLDDGPMTGNGHRYRYLVVNGAHIGMRESLTALANLAKRCNGLDADGLRALQSAEMDREDAAKANPDSALAKAYARSY